MEALTTDSATEVKTLTAPRPIQEPARVLFVTTLQTEAENQGELDLTSDLASEGFRSSYMPIITSFVHGASIGQTTDLPNVALAQLPARLVAQAATGQRGQADLALNPKELGRMRFSIQHHGDRLMVTLSAERPETLALLRQNAPQLLAEFASAGFAGTSLGFGQWGDGERRTYRQPEHFATLEGQPVLVPLPTRKGPVRGLDLRL